LIRDRRKYRSAISKRDFDKFKPFENAVMKKSVVLKYTGDIVPLGILKVKVAFQNKNWKLELFVLPGKSSPIIGQNWFQAVDIVQFNKLVEKLSVKAVSEEPNDICKRFESFFSRKLRHYTKKKFKLLKD